ncbi:hypothetical protein pb186bvf_007829 [Paramecium bursaria]
MQHLLLVQLLIRFPSMSLAWSSKKLYYVGTKVSAQFMEYLKFLNNYLIILNSQRDIFLNYINIRIAGSSIDFYCCKKKCSSKNQQLPQSIH